MRGMLARILLAMGFVLMVGLAVLGLLLTASTFCARGWDCPP